MTSISNLGIDYKSPFGDLDDVKEAGNSKELKVIQQAVSSAGNNISSIKSAIGTIDDFLNHDNDVIVAIAVNALVQLIVKATNLVKEMPAGSKDAEEISEFLLDVIKQVSNTNAGQSPKITSILENVSKNLKETLEATRGSSDIFAFSKGRFEGLKERAFSGTPRNRVGIENTDRGNLVDLSV